MLADKLGDKAINAAEYIKIGRSADLSSDKPWVFVSPVYGWRIPHVFADFIRRSRFSGNRNAYFVITCGSDIGNAAKYLIPICEEKGLSFCGALEAVMPENYLAMFPVPDEEKSAKIISAVHPLLENAASFIASSKPFEKRSYRIGDNIKSSVVNKYFCRYFIKASPFYSKDSCVGCGKCVSLCPLNNIKLKDSRPAWGDNCTHCMACICHCPVEAIEYGRHSIAKRRYLCPEYKGASSI